MYLHALVTFQVIYPTSGKKVYLQQKIFSAFIQSEVYSTNTETLAF